MTDDPLWYKDAVFYELHVKAFQDSNADGLGDFRGLVQRLDYVRDLGADVIWLLPFYPSPLRDDGYDIADYYNVHSNYGTLEDFQAFLDEAHRRGLRVIADLVLNHTSDQHPWFQRARRAPKGSPERDFYVWSDTDEKYREARIIFTDTEPSNWTWDPVAGQYYWHRFFAHQPDLNWDNPAVKEEMFRVMEYWLARGLDGFRADAVPYLIEREGTICENLPETHAILKEFRTRLDATHPGKILLAEANQWPADVRPYFGDGDEFQMAFHFPLMPRIFMAVRQGIRGPIVEIVQQTPEIPPECQWCMFLRNHDEMTLEMVTDDERDYMYDEYAADPRMRLNLGIRRRLAPLMDNDRRKVELLNSILFTMPGSPIVYYGDELGMGDNIWLGDRDGVRTPMQWSPDRNAGFSRAEPGRLYLPTIQDSIFGFQAINVEAQERSPYSLLNWMKRLIAVRKQHRAFGRGSIEFLEPENPHVLAYLREYDGDALLIVANLSGAAQSVRLDLSRFSGHTPVELLGHTEFLPIDETPYALTLSPYGFFWFALRGRTAAAEEEVPTEWAEQEAAVFENAGELATLLHAVPMEWLYAQRWFRGKGREVAGLDLWDHAVMPGVPGRRALLAFVEVRYAAAPSEVYLLPLTLGTALADAEAEPMVEYAAEAGEFPLFEASAEPATNQALYELIASGGELSTSNAVLIGRRTAALEGAPRGTGRIRPLKAEQSNTSVLVDERWVLKLLRKLDPDTSTEVEVARFLLERTEFRDTPALGGWIEYASRGAQPSTIAALFAFVPNLGDAWSYSQRALRRYLAAASRSAADPGSVSGREATRRMMGDYLPAVRELGAVTGEMHRALGSAGPDDAAFAPEPIRADELLRGTRALAEAEGVLHEIARGGADLPEAMRAEAAALLGRLGSAVPSFGVAPADLHGLMKIRVHGDYHLGQVLRTEANGWSVLDFEGEPARSPAERRQKYSPLKDVAGMLRSFEYALHTAVREHGSGAGVAAHPLEHWAEAWLREVRSAFLSEYRAATRGAAFLPSDDALFRRVLAGFELEKAVYELGYELRNRPDWLWIPLRGVAALLTESAA